MGQIVNSRSVVHLPGGDPHQRTTVGAAIDAGPTPAAVTAALPTATVTPTGGTAPTIIPNLFGRHLYPEDRGAPTDGTGDCSAAVAAILGSNGVCRFRYGNLYRCTSTIALAAGQQLWAEGGTIFGDHDGVVVLMNSNYCGVIGDGFGLIKSRNNTPSSAVSGNHIIKLIDALYKPIIRDVRLQGAGDALIYSGGDTYGLIARGIEGQFGQTLLKVRRESYNLNMVDWGLHGLNIRRGIDIDTGYGHRFPGLRVEVSDPSMITAGWGDQEAILLRNTISISVDGKYIEWNAGTANIIDTLGDVNTVIRAMMISDNGTTNRVGFIAIGSTSKRPVIVENRLKSGQTKAAAIVNASTTAAVIRDNANDGGFTALCTDTGTKTAIEDQGKRLSTLYTEGAIAGAISVDARVAGDSFPRVRVQSGNSIDQGDGTATPDTTHSRTSANRLDMAAGDGFKLDGTYNGGHVQFGSNHLWCDASSPGVLRVKASAPASAGDGVSVGSQT